MHHIYTKIFLSLSFCLLGAVIIFNYLIDPYDIYTHDIIKIKKHIVYSSLRMHKAYSVSTLKPKTIIAGSSRTQQGYNPANELLLHKPVYNMGLVLTNIYETYRYIQHASAQGKLKQLFLTLDLFSFNAMLPNRSDFNENYFAVSKDGKYQTDWRHPHLFGLLSFGALSASSRTILLANESRKPLIDRNGMQNQGSLHRAIMSLGHRASSLMIEKQFAKFVLFPAPSKEFRFINPHTQLSSYKIFRDLLTLCHNKNIETYIIINPTHARFQELYYLRGLWDRYESWKKQLAEINHAVASKQNTPAFDIWDFTGYNSVTTEKVPASKTQAMKFFWESVHFKPHTGNIVLSKVLSKITPDKVSDFGTKLTINNIDKHLVSIRTQRQHYIKSNQNELQGLYSAMKETDAYFSKLKLRLKSQQ